MTNSVYPSLLEYFLEFLVNNDVKASLIDTTVYTYTPSTDKYYSSIPSNAIISSGVLLTGKTGTLGEFMADDCQWNSVEGNQVGAVVFYQDTGDSATSRLVAYFDTISGVPFTPNGSSVSLSWDKTAGYIFKIKTGE